jgi:hypothetical protein
LEGTHAVHCDLTSTDDLVRRKVVRSRFLIGEVSPRHDPSVDRHGEQGQVLSAATHVCNVEELLAPN